MYCKRCGNFTNDESGLCDDCTHTSLYDNNRNDHGNQLDDDNFPQYYANFNMDNNVELTENHSSKNKKRVFLFALSFFLGLFVCGYAVYATKGYEYVLPNHYVYLMIEKQNFDNDMKSLKLSSELIKGYNLNKPFKNNMVLSLNVSNNLPSKSNAMNDNEMLNLFAENKDFLNLLSSLKISLNSQNDMKNNKYYNEFITNYKDKELFKIDTWLDKNDFILGNQDIFNKYYKFDIKEELLIDLEEKQKSFNKEITVEDLVKCLDKYIPVFADTAKTADISINRSVEKSVSSKNLKLKEIVVKLNKELSIEFVLKLLKQVRDDKELHDLLFKDTSNQATDSKSGFEAYQKNISDLISSFEKESANIPLEITRRLYTDDNNNTIINEIDLDGFNMTNAIDLNADSAENLTSTENKISTKFNFTTINGAGNKEKTYKFSLYQKNKSVYFRIDNKILSASKDNFSSKIELSIGAEPEIESLKDFLPQKASIDFTETAVGNKRISDLKLSLIPKISDVSLDLTMNIKNTFEIVESLNIPNVPVNNVTKISQDPTEEQRIKESQDLVNGFTKLLTNPDYDEILNILGIDKSILDMFNPDENTDNSDPDYSIPKTELDPYGQSTNANYQNRQNTNVPYQNGQRKGNYNPYKQNQIDQLPEFFQNNKLSH